MKILLTACLVMALPVAGLAASPSRSTSEELKKSHAELIELLNHYTDRHPLVLAKLKEVAVLEKRLALEKYERANSRNSAQLQRAREELHDLLAKYTDQHPLVLTKRKEITALEKMRRSD